jgi:hypothetical protein
MAFGWFRRRQKMVMIVMVILMVAFLIPTGLQHLIEPNPGKEAIGRTSEGKVTLGDRLEAKVDVDLLKALWRNANAQGRQDPALSFLINANVENNEDMAYLLLLKEAQKAEVRVTRADVDQYLTQAGFRADAVGELAQQLRLTERRLRAALTDWVKIRKTFIASVVDSPPSDEEIRSIYRDLNEKTKLRMVEVSADELAKKLPEPADANRITDQFLRFREMQKGAFTDTNPFGFGYRLPDQVAVQYLLIQNAVVDRAAQPGEVQKQEYFLDPKLKAELVKELAASRPAGAGEVSYTEAEPLIARKLKPEMTQARMDDLTAKAKTWMKDFAEREAELKAATASAPAKSSASRPTTMPAGFYEEFIPKTALLDANEVLSRPVRLALEDRPLDEVVRKLAKEAKLDAICYPWDVPGSVRVPPSIRVSVKPRPGRTLTLGDALADITSQLRLLPPATQPTGRDPNTATAPSQPTTQHMDVPDLKWARCVGFENVLFPVEGIRFFPVVARQTPLLTPEEFMKDSVLVRCAAGARQDQSLIYAAFMAEPFTRDPKPAGAMKVGADGQAMICFAPGKSGRLLWRLTGAEPSHAPAGFDEKPGIEQQVKDDLRAVQGFELAMTKAKQLIDTRLVDQFVPGAKGEGARVLDTEFFARKSRVQERDGRAYYVPTGVPELEMPTPELRQQLLDLAFNPDPNVGMVPRNVEPPFKRESDKFVTMLVPAKRQVLLLRRVDFEPAVIKEYEETGRLEILQELSFARMYETYARWFQLDFIKQRMDFRPPS